MASVVRSSDYWTNADKHMLYFENKCKLISESKDINDARDELNDMYQYLKDITHEYFNGNELIGGYKYLKQILLNCEQSMPIDFIMESTPNYEIGLMNEEVPNNKDIFYKLNWLVYMTRKHLDQKRKYPSTRNKSFNELDLADECEKSSNRVMYLAKLMGLKCHQVIIYPGFSEYPELYEGSGYHYINVIEYENQKYIIDCTYRQFFTTTYNNLNRLGIVDVSGCRPGVFMLMDENRKKLAQEILKNGWVLATDENVKNYFDGFAISFRNGLYYIATNDYSYTTKYKVDDYKSFLRGMDSQINRESYETLGFQRTLKPTSKNIINF